MFLKAFLVCITKVSTSVASGRFYNTHTNEGGLICLTIPANESLACSALSVWVQGMDADKTIDITPTGNIQKRLANIKTKKDLKPTAVEFRVVFGKQISKVRGWRSLLVYPACFQAEGFIFSNYMDKTAREQLKNFIEDAKSWLKHNKDTVTTNSENLTIGGHDKPDSNPSTYQLPSSASWLSNNV